MDTNKLADIGVLGILEERGPLELSTVQNRLQHNFQRYWAYSYGVLSTAIDRLIDGGYIRQVHNHSVNEVKTYRYGITELGIDQLQELLQTPLIQPDSPDRTGLVIQVGFLHHLSPSDQREVLGELEDILYQRRRDWIDVRSLHADEVDSGSKNIGYRLQIIDLNIRLLDSQIEWLQDLELQAPIDR